MKNGAQPNELSCAASPNSLLIARGQHGTTLVTITPSGGFTGKVALSASGMGSGVTASFTQNPATSTSTLWLSATATGTPGTYTIVIQGVSGGLTHTNDDDQFHDSHLIAS